MVFEGNPILQGSQECLRLQKSWSLARALLRLSGQCPGGSAVMATTAQRTAANPSSSSDSRRNFARSTVILQKFYLIGAAPLKRIFGCRLDKAASVCHWSRHLWFQQDSLRQPSFCCSFTTYASAAESGSLGRRSLSFTSLPQQVSRRLSCGITTSWEMKVYFMLLICPGTPPTFWLECFKRMLCLPLWLAAILADCKQKIITSYLNPINPGNLVL